MLAALETSSVSYGLDRREDGGCRKERGGLGEGPKEWERPEEGSRGRGCGGSCVADVCDQGWCCSGERVLVCKAGASDGPAGVCRDEDGGGPGAVGCGAQSCVGRRLDDVGEADENRLVVAHRLAGRPLDPSV